MYACYTGHENVVTLLLEAGVSVNSINDKQATPLMLAASCGNDGIARCLLEVRFDWALFYYIHLLLQVL